MRGMLLFVVFINRFWRLLTRIQHWSCKQLIADRLYRDIVTFHHFQHGQSEVITYLKVLSRIRGCSRYLCDVHLTCNFPVYMLKVSIDIPRQRPKVCPLASVRLVYISRLKKKKRDDCQETIKGHLLKIPMAGRCHYSPLSYGHI